MALSNWDSMAFDGGGKPGRSSMDFDGTIVEVYKNWVNVRRGDLLDTFNQGDVSFGDVHVVVERFSEQSAAFMFAVRGWGDDAQKFSGIGCYGYGGEDGNEFVGVLPETFEAFKAWLRDRDEEYAARIGGGERQNQGDAYFAKKMGFEASSSSPGEATEPLLMQILKEDE